MIQPMNVDLPAFTGHKALIGRTGIGVLCVRKHVELRQTLYDDGRSLRSSLPPGAVPMAHGVRDAQHRGASRPSVGVQGWIAAEGLESAHRREMVLAGRLFSGLREIEGVRLCCCESMQNHLSTVSVNIEGMEAAGGGVASFSPNNPCDMLHRRKTFGLQPFGHLPSFRSAWFPGIGRRMKSPVRNARVHAGFVQPSCP